MSNLNIFDKKSVSSSGSSADKRSTFSALLSKVPAAPSAPPIVKLPPPTTAVAPSSPTYLGTSHSPSSSSASSPNSIGSANHQGNVSPSPTTIANTQSPVLGGRVMNGGSSGNKLEELKRNPLNTSGGFKGASPGYRSSTTLAQLTSQSIPSNSDSSPPSSLFSNSSSSSPTNDSLIYQDHESNYDANTKFAHLVVALKTQGAQEAHIGHSACLVEETMYVFGGVAASSGTPSNAFHSFNFATKTWTALSTINGPSPRAHHTAIVWGGALYIFGGDCSGSLRNDLFVYTFDTQLWSEITAAEGVRPAPRFGHSAVVDGACMIVYGGVIGNKLTNDMHSLNLETRTWTPISSSAPPARAFHSATLYKGVMYVIGGQDSTTTPLEDVHCFTVASSTWRPLTTEGPFTARSHHSALLLQDSILLTGGNTVKSTVPVLEVYELDLHQKKWFKIQTNQQGLGRAGHCTVMKGTSLFMLGGSTDASIDYLVFGKDEMEDFQEDDSDMARLQNIPKALWESTLMKKHPEILDWRERTQYLTGVRSYGRALASPSFTENKSAVTHQIVLQLIMEYLERHTPFHKSIQTIERESHVLHQPTETGESRLITLLRLVRPRLRGKNVLEPELSLRDAATDVEVFDEEVPVVDNIYRRMDNEEDINVWDEGEDNQRNIRKLDGENGKVQIKSATLNKLIQYLTPEREKTHDLYFMKSFLYTHQSFTTSEMLLKKLIQRYSDHPALEGKDTARLKQELVEPIRKRVCDVLKYWIDKCPWDFKSGPTADKLVASLNNFIDGALTRDGNPSVKNLRRILVQTRTAENTSTSIVYSTNPPEPKVPKNIFSPQLTLSHIDELEIARQLTLIEYKMFRSIPPPEFLVRVTPYGEFQYSMATSPNLISFLNRGSDVMRWVAHTVLTMDQKKLRTKMIEKYIKIMESLRQLNNFQTLYSIYLGLQHASLQSVNDIFTIRSKEFLLEIDSLFSKSDSSKNYREILSKSSLPCIPLVHVIQEDISIVEKGTPSLVNVLINFVKRQNLYNIICKVEAYQLHSYNLQPVHQVSTFVNKLPKASLVSQTTSRAQNLTGDQSLEPALLLDALSHLSSLRIEGYPPGIDHQRQDSKHLRHLQTWINAIALATSGRVGDQLRVLKLAIPLSTTHIFMPLTRLVKIKVNIDPQNIEAGLLMGLVHSNLDTLESIKIGLYLDEPAHHYLCNRLYLTLLPSTTLTHLSITGVQHPNFCPFHLFSSTPSLRHITAQVSHHNDALFREFLANPGYITSITTDILLSAAYIPLLATLPFPSLHLTTPICQQHTYASPRLPSTLTSLQLTTQSNFTLSNQLFDSLQGHQHLRTLYFVIDSPSPRSSPMLSLSSFLQSNRSLTTLSIEYAPNWSLDTNDLKHLYLVLEALQHNTLQYLTIDGILPSSSLATLSALFCALTNLILARLQFSSSSLAFSDPLLTLFDHRLQTFIEHPECTAVYLMKRS
eukprot:gene15331-18170_t